MDGQGGIDPDWQLNLAAQVQPSTAAQPLRRNPELTCERPFVEVLCPRLSVSFCPLQPSLA